MASVAKAKRRSLTIEQRLKVLQQLNEKNTTKTEIAKQFGVHISTISKIKINEKQLLQKAAMNSSRNLKSKYVVSGKYHKLEQALFYWFLQMRDKNEIVTTSLLKMQARKFSSALKIPENFKFSSKWIQNFKKRFGIRKLKLTGEKLSSDTKNIEPFKNEFFRNIKKRKLLASQIYNADESALFFKMLPTHSLVHENESSAPGCKIAKDRVTFLPCANVTGTHKIPILLIGKSKKPRAFKNIRLPLEYSSSKNAWMTRSIFKEWFFETFIPHVRQFSKESGIAPKALLLLDNCSAHHFEHELVSDDRLITVTFLPPNVTPLLQPMDQHVIQMVKTKYREKLHNEIVFGELNSVEHLKQINLKHAAFWLHEAWLEVTPKVVQSSWKKIGMVVGDSFMHEDDVPLKTLFGITDDEYTRNFTTDFIEEELCVDEYTEADIIGMVNGDDNQNSSNDEDEDFDSSQTAPMDIDDITSTGPSYSRDQQAVNCLSFLIEWAEGNELDLNDILYLRRMKGSVLAKCTQH